MTTKTSTKAKTKTKSAAKKADVLTEKELLERSEEVKNKTFLKFFNIYYLIVFVLTVVFYIVWCLDSIVPNGLNIDGGADNLLNMANALAIVTLGSVAIEKSARTKFGASFATVLLSIICVLITLVAVYLVAAIEDSTYGLSYLNFIFVAFALVAFTIIKLIEKKD